MTRIGVTLPLDDLELREHRAPLAALVEAGFDAVWTGEVNGVDGLTPLTLFRGWEPAVGVGCAVVSVFTRGPALLAMSAASLGEVAGTDAWFGIGAGSKPIVEAWNGFDFDKPYTRVSETLAFLRDVLANGRPGDDYPNLGTSRFRLARVPEAPPRLLVAALGPKMQRLAARKADGVALNFLSAGDVSTVRDYTDDVQREVESDLVRIARVFVVPGSGEASEVAARRHIAGYLTVPVYAQFQRWLGREAELRAMWEAWEQGERAQAVQSIPDEVVHELVITGDPNECAAGIAEYFQAGIDEVTVLLLQPFEAPVTAEAQVTFLKDMSAALS